MSPTDYSPKLRVMIKPILIGSGMVIAIGLVSVAAISYIQNRQGTIETVASNGKPIVLSSPGSSESNSSYTASLDKPTASKKPVEDGGLKVLREGEAFPTSNSVAGPDDFEEYEKYKDQTTALFGDLKQGDGAMADVNRAATVHYRGWLTNGTEFDQSFARGQPFTFVIGEHKVILGWEQAILGMKVGGKRRFIIPPSAGYGAEDKNGIPPNSVLVFDVELLAVK